VYAAAGLPLDNDAISVYRQSYISAHSELTWILDCFTGFGEMSRMTQFKDKSSKLGDQQISIGLFNYPVLMAADILLYNAQYVPVGDDQTQHLEFTRDIAERMNSKFGNVFTVPEAVAKQHEFFGKDQGLRIKDLVDPSKKMSKSDETGKGVIFLNDDPVVAAKKIMSATTDDKAEIHYDKVEQPGISNLLDILALLRGQPVNEVAAEFEGQTRYGDFKRVVADAVVSFLTEFQARLAAVDDATIVAKLESSERAMNEVAKATLLRAQQAVGLRSRG
jgi:tryptophanyl-tRNA synthetase